MRIVIFVLAAIAVLFVATAIYVRVAPIDPSEWHVDPETVTPPDTPNFELLAGPTASQIDAAPLAVAERIEGVAQADGARVLSGSAASGFVTYVVRSRIMGFPDLVSITLEPEEGGTQLNIYSRSRFGRSDLGVNARRVQAWVAAARGD